MNFRWFVGFLMRRRTSQRVMPTARDVTLFYESLEIVRRSYSLAVVESRYELMCGIPRPTMGWEAWYEALREARDKRWELHLQERQAAALAEAAKAERIHAEILEKVLAIVAAHPGIVQTEILSKIDGFTRDEVRLALWQDAQEHGHLSRHRYRSTYKLYIR